MMKNSTFEDLDREDMVIVGDVDECARKVERYRDAGLDHFIALMQADRIPHEQVMRSIELFGGNHPGFDKASDR
jgi:alkanesulfonate monooxygenase SsuD/methylene tetrahydromethanopterin reductase-like flavin-dependent oxidoreductase (luciferase family)